METQFYSRKKKKSTFTRYTSRTFAMEPLFSTLFPAADKGAWLAQVQKELKSETAPPADLRWSTDEGFTLEPYYTADDLSALPLNTIQAAQKQVPGWLNAPEYAVSDERVANLALRDALTRGADALVVRLPEQGSSRVESLARLLDHIKLSDTPLFFRPSSGPVTNFVQVLKTVAPYQLKGGLLSAVDESTAEVTRLTADSPQFCTVCVGSHAFHNAGATATQELAFTLASLADAYDQLTNEGLTIGQLVPKTVLSVSVGTSYFLEIAKLRALRVLLARFLSAYAVSAGSSVFIHAQTSTFYDATATPNTNLLRATTEAMAAVMGGCDALTVHPYDAVLGQPSEFSDRIARNVSVLLREESYLDKVADPSAGSYYIENLTHQLTESAWILFLDVEKMGGYTRAFASGFVQGELSRVYQAKIDAVRNGNVLVGVTKFRHDEENRAASNSATPEQNLFASDTLPDRRLAEPFE